MFTFTAHFYKDKIYINNDLAYKNNEFLTEVVNKSQFDDLLECRGIFIKESQKLLIYTNMEDYEIEEYDTTVQQFQNIMRKIDNLFASLSITKFIFKEKNTQNERLFDLLNSHRWIWYDGDVDDDDYEDENFSNDYFYNYPITNGYENTHIVNYQKKYLPKDIESDILDDDMIKEIHNLNEELKTLCDNYLIFIEDLLRVKYLYIDFIDNFLNSQNKFLDADSLAETFINFIEKTKNNPDRDYLKFTSGYSKFFHTVKKSGNHSILCESYKFTSLGAFLYFDLFKGISNNFIPKKCENCGTYFLITAGKYSDYCENISPQDSTKKCREIGSRKKYSDKCKSDPVWQIYNRAYKAHYARYMKKKMTVSDFEKWSSWAVEWRTKAENDEISLDEYTMEIKK